MEEQYEQQFYQDHPEYQQQPQQNPYQQQQVQPMPDSHLAKAILVTIFCCQILGIVSIVKAASVQSLYSSGQYAAAQEASNSANKWANWGIGLGIAFAVIYGIFCVAYIALVGAAAAFNS